MSKPKVHLRQVKHINLHAYPYVHEQAAQLSVFRPSARARVRLRSYQGLQTTTLQTIRGTVTGMTTNKTISLEPLLLLALVLVTTVGRSTI